jgi:hypothetical protein
VCIHTDRQTGRRDLFSASPKVDVFAPEIAEVSTHLKTIKGQMGVSINGGAPTGCFRMDNPTKMDNLGMDPF